MKKALIIVVSVIVVIVSIKVLNLNMYINEIPSRFAKYHNTINVSVTDNEKTLDIENTKVSYKSDNNVLIDTQEILNGEVKFKKGMYGLNTFNFKIPNVSIGEFEVGFGQFNTNWWHVCMYDLNVDVATIDAESVEVTLKVNISVGDNEQTYEKTKVLTKEDSFIFIF